MPTPMKLFSFPSKFLICLVLAASVASVHARQATAPLISDFLLEVSPPTGTSGQPGYFGIQVLSGSVLRYSLTSGEIVFGAGDEVIANAASNPDQFFSDRFQIRAQDRSGLYNPLVCFDLSGSPAPVEIVADDLNGHTVIDSFFLDADLTYDLRLDQIGFTAPAQGACFYRPYDLETDRYGDFGLFGQAPVDGDLSISYDVPASVVVGGTLNYERVITNNSSEDLNVHFQEVFPANPGFFASASFAADELAVRDSATLTAAGGSSTVTVSRAVTLENAKPGEYLDLYFAVAAADATGGILWNTEHRRVRVTEADVNRSSVAASPSTGVVADGDDAATITVTVRDPNNALVEGQAVTLAVTNGDMGTGGLSATSVVSGPNGVAQASLTSTRAETITVSAYLGSSVANPLIGTVSVDFEAGSASQIAVNAGDNQTATVGTTVTTAPSVLVTDANANPVQGVSVTFAVASGGGSVSPTAAVTTGANGVASVSSWTLGLGAGENTLTATSSGLAGSPVTFTATGTAGAAAQIAINEGDGQTGVAGAEVSTPPSVLVTDANGNPVAGASVVFAVASGGGSVDPTTAVTTGSDGIAKVTSWILGKTAGPNSLTATSTGLTGSPVTFSATGEAGAASQLFFVSSTADLPVGQSRTLTVEVRDVNENLVSSASGFADFVAVFDPDGGSITVLDGTNSARRVISNGIVTLTVEGVSAGPVTVTVEGVADLSNVDLGSTTFSVVDP